MWSRVNILQPKICLNEVKATGKDCDCCARFNDMPQEFFLENEDTGRHKQILGQYPPGGSSIQNGEPVEQRNDKLYDKEQSRKKAEINGLWHRCVF